MLDALFKVVKFFQDLHPELVAKVIPFVLKTLQFFYVREILLLLLSGIDSLEEEAQEMSSVFDEKCCILILLANTELSQLLNADHQLVQLL